MTPVWDDAGQAVLFFTAARGHHTDIGGLTPGSMPPDSRTIHDEGAYIDNWRLVEAGRFREAETRALLLSAPHPVRAVEINLADLKAQVASCEKGAQELRRMVAQFGLPVVRAYMGHVQDNAENACAGPSRPCRMRTASIPWTRISTAPPRDPGEDHRRPRRAGRHHRLHRHHP